jgi:hypothetical protein
MSVENKREIFCRPVLPLFLLLAAHTRYLFYFSMERKEEGARFPPAATTKKRKN